MYIMCIFSLCNLICIGDVFIECLKQYVNGVGQASEDIKTSMQGGQSISTPVNRTRTNRHEIAATPASLWCRVNALVYSSVYSFRDAIIMHKTWQTCSLFFTTFSAPWLLYWLQAFTGACVRWKYSSLANSNAKGMTSPKNCHHK